MTAKNKSPKPVAPVPDEATAPIEPAKEDEVSPEQFISTSMLGEINRKLDKRPKH